VRAKPGDVNEVPEARRRAGLVAVAAVAAIGLGLAGAFVLSLRARGLPVSFATYRAAREQLITAAASALPAGLAFVVGQWLGHVFLSPPFYLATAAILFVEWAWPVRRDQLALSPSFVHDLLWYLAVIGGFVAVSGGAWRMSLANPAVVANCSTMLARQNQRNRRRSQPRQRSLGADRQQRRLGRERNRRAFQHHQRDHPPGRAVEPDRRRGRQSGTPDQ